MYADERFPAQRSHVRSCLIQCSNSAQFVYHSVLIMRLSFSIEEACTFFSSAVLVHVSGAKSWNSTNTERVKSAGVTPSGSSPLLVVIIVVIIIIVIIVVIMLE